MWVISLLMTTIGSGLNMLFSLRSPSITITSYVAQLIVYPVGLAWDKVMPNRQYTTFGVKWNLNPGPFNFKEHAMIVIMANASFGTGVGYFTDILQAQRGFYKFNWGWGFGVLVALSTQCVGFGLAGLFSRWLVEPAPMIWPQDLVNCAFMYTLHDNSKTDPSKTNGWSISRYRWFFYVFLGSFLYYWFPGYIAQFLSVFAFPTWIAPNNVNVNKVFGGFSGMALLPITFDWTQITGYVFSPLIPPWHAIGNTLIGLVVFYWVVAAGVHFSGTWYADYLPFSTSSSYDNSQYYNLMLLSFFISSLILWFRCKSVQRQPDFNAADHFGPQEVRRIFSSFPVNNIRTLLWSFFRCDLRRGCPYRSLSRKIHS